MPLEIGNKMKMFYGDEVMFYYDAKSVLSLGMKIPHPQNTSWTGYFKVKEFVKDGVSLDYISETCYDDTFFCKSCNMLMTEDYYEWIDKYLEGLKKAATKCGNFTAIKKIEDIENEILLIPMFVSKQAMCKSCIDNSVIHKETNVPIVT